MVPRVGDLVRMVREPGVEDIPVGLLVEAESAFSRSMVNPVVGLKDAWCTIQWNDGELTGVWIDEIERVECK